MEWVKLVAEIGTPIAGVGLLFLAVYHLIIFLKKWSDLKLKKMVNEQKNLHHETMKTRLRITPEVKGMLKELLLQTNSSRAYVFEFHNGTTSLGGLPFVYMSCTYEVLGNLASSQMHARQNMAFTLYESLIEKLISDEVITVINKEITPGLDDVIYETIKKRGTKVLIGTKLLDEHKRVIGFVGIDYCGNTNRATTNLDDPKYIKEMKKIVYREAQALSTLLYVKIFKDEKIKLEE